VDGGRGIINWQLYYTSLYYTVIRSVIQVIHLDEGDGTIAKVVDKELSPGGRICPR
jgi:hypothetical protein